MEWEETQKDNIAEEKLWGKWVEHLVLLSSRSQHALANMANQQGKVIDRNLVTTEGTHSSVATVLGMILSW